MKALTLHLDVLLQEAVGAELPQVNDDIALSDLYSQVVVAAKVLELKEAINLARIEGLIIVESLLQSLERAIFCYPAIEDLELEG